MEIGDVVQEALRGALRDVWRRYPQVVRENTSERCVVAKVAAALQVRIDNALGEGFRADVDHNRSHPRDVEGNEAIRTKYLGEPKENDRGEQVTPDLIVHDGTGDVSRNLLVVEAKKGDVRAGGRKRDYDKLRGYLHVFQYKQAAFVEWDARGGPPRLEWMTFDTEMPDPRKRAREIVEVQQLSG
ncbi:hypothetical protein [Streptomyces nanshensis]|uniref:Restriction endonuclease n=1 Tax=Streptomyces nanshensis TaxID=518642 RepID=A0A1E7L862_9ACTN|nr:hypothetical protein [Streptomyces nanshensis]OEV12396.1 hypothetical protein AN218_08460 [Streptomyces nanshensis]